MNPKRHSELPAPGKFFICPRCGEESIARKKTVMEGWRATGEVVVCSLCNAQVGTVEAAVKAAERQDGERLKGAEALLGARLEARKTLTRDGTEKFCKNCRHYLVHPFQSRCLYWNRPVEPMSDCAKFENKPSEPAP